MDTEGQDGARDRTGSHGLEGEAELSEAQRVYLDVWGMGVDPEGHRLMVTSAAHLAGVSASRVRHWRREVPGFRALERQARRYSRGYYQRLARRNMDGLTTPAAKALYRHLASGEADPALAWKVLTTAADIGERLELHQDLSGPGLEAWLSARAQAQRELSDWQEDHGVGDVDPGAESPPLREPTDRG